MSNAATGISTKSERLDTTAAQGTATANKAMPMRSRTCPDMVAGSPVGCDCERYIEFIRIGQRFAECLPYIEGSVDAVDMRQHWTAKMIKLRLAAAS